MKVQCVNFLCLSTLFGNARSDHLFHSKCSLPPPPTPLAKTLIEENLFKVTNRQNFWTRSNANSAIITFHIHVASLFQTTSYTTREKKWKRDVLLQKKDT